MRADEADQIEATKAIIDMLDENSLDDARVDGDTLEDDSSRETEDARRPLTDVTTRSRPPASGRQPILHRPEPESDTVLSVYRAEAQRDAPMQSQKIERAQTRPTAKTHALGGTGTKAGTTQLQPRIRRARLSNNIAVSPRNKVLPRIKPLDDDIDTCETSDTISLPTLPPPLDPMPPLVRRPLPPAKAAFTVQLKINLEIEVVIKARIYGDVLLSVL